jgi:hypothetical protein
VAREADAAEQTVCNYFPTKEQLVTVASSRFKVGCAT